MKKLLAVLLATSSLSVFADDFQSFNNNLYAAYQYTGTNGSNATYASDYGIGGTFQSKNNVWLNANAVSGMNNGATNSNLGLAAGYAFQFFGDENQGFQVVPHVNFSTQSATGEMGQGATQYVYGFGVKPEYRLLSSLKVALDMNLYGTQLGTTASNQNTTQQFGYSLTPGVQYDISKTVMLGLDYTYADTFNNNSTVAPGVNQTSNGYSIVTAKVGYLF